MSDIKAHHCDLPGCVEDDGRRLGVNQNVEFSRGGGVALRIAPAHEDYFGHALDKAWSALDAHPEIGQWPGRYDGNFAGSMLPDGLEVKVHPGAATGRREGRRVG